MGRGRLGKKIIWREIGRRGRGEARKKEGRGKKRKNMKRGGKGKRIGKSREERRKGGREKKGVIGVKRLLIFVVALFLFFFSKYLM